MRIPGSQLRPILAVLIEAEIFPAFNLICKQFSFINRNQKKHREKFVLRKQIYFRTPQTHFFLQIHSVALKLWKKISQLRLELLQEFRKNWKKLKLFIPVFKNVQNHSFEFFSFLRIYIYEKDEANWFFDGEWVEWKKSQESICMNYKQV